MKQGYENKRMLSGYSDLHVYLFLLYEIFRLSTLGIKYIYIYIHIHVFYSNYIFIKLSFY